MEKQITKRLKIVCPCCNETIYLQEDETGKIVASAENPKPKNPKPDEKTEKSIWEKIWSDE